MSERRSEKNLRPTSAEPDLGAYGEYWDVGNKAPSPEADALRDQLRQQSGADAGPQTDQDKIAVATEPTAVVAGEATAVTGLRAILRRRQLRDRPGTQPEKTTQDYEGPDWNTAARERKNYSLEEGRWPSSGKEWRRSRKAFRRSDTLGTLRATQAVDQHGVYDIDPETGKSLWRDENGSLRDHPHTTQKSIRKVEREYQERQHMLTNGEEQLGYPKETGSTGRATVIRVEDAPTPHNELYPNGHEQGAETPQNGFDPAQILRIKQGIRDQVNPLTKAAADKAAETAQAFDAGAFRTMMEQNAVRGFLSSQLSIPMEEFDSGITDSSRARLVSQFDKLYHTEDDELNRLAQQGAAVSGKPHRGPIITIIPGDEVDQASPRVK
ncbi:MAG TPA: hypothetical protein VK674_05970 [Candidatus Limnocylindria bacterium]|nr:hypothetical protein [Candidatus Limnocylindria bacterium]